MPDFYDDRLTCPLPECGGTEFEPEDTEVPEGPALCLSCGETLVPEEFPWVKKYQNFVVAAVEAAEPVKKLNKLKVRITEGEEGEDNGGFLNIVTNDLKVKAGELVVIARIGAVVPAGKSLDDGGIEVKKASVGGFPSEGMVCDAPMLDWVGGGKGAAVKLDAEKFSIGSRPPDKKPR
ncbi:unnamed protein product [Amoebophrya sp. A25]|nr:unnamed protein product [Amoebophrya sp. A25]|eukprot:GSA25T00002859001.1